MCSHMGLSIPGSQKGCLWLRDLLEYALFSVEQYVPYLLWKKSIGTVGIGVGEKLNHLQLF